MSIYWFPIRISYLISPFPQYCDPLYEGEFNLLSTDYGDSSLVKYTELTLCSRFLSPTHHFTSIVNCQVIYLKSVSEDENKY